MAKVIFNIQYEIKENKKDEYLMIVREIKNLLQSDGLESYKVFEVKGKPNHYQEVYEFSSPEAYEAFDDNENERINILISKLGELTAENSTRYTTLYEMEIN